MKIKALYKDEWHEVEGVHKCDDAVSYKLKGVDKTVPAKKIKDLDKGEVTNPDGSVTRFPGHEQLKKPLSKGINLRDRWEMLKARLNHETAFKDMDIFNTEEEDSKGQEDATEAIDSSSPGGAEAQAVDGGVPPSSPADQEPADAGEVGDNEGPEQPGEAQEDGAGEPAADSPESEDIQPLKDEELVEALKELGYSEPEIAYILHGHGPGFPSEEEIKAEQAKQNLSQDQEGHKQTLDQRSEEHDVDLEHKKKMHELELEYAKREKELKLKHLEQELELKRDKIKSGMSGSKQ